MNKGEMYSLVGIAISLAVVGIILFNTVRGIERELQNDIKQVQTEVHELNLKVAGIEAKLDVLISAWNLEMPTTPTVASNQ